MLRILTGLTFLMFFVHAVENRNVGLAFLMMVLIAALLHQGEKA